MGRKLLIVLLAICFVLPQLTAFAEGEDIRSLFADGSYPYADSLYETNEIADGAKLTVQYIPGEQESSANAPEIGCEAAYAADEVSGKVFYEKNAHKKMYPASTTKLLTALVVLETCAMDESVTVSASAVGMVPEGYVRANLQPGEKLSVYSLLQALLIPSANDAAFVLAEHVSGSVEAFAARSNQRAQELGCETLHFVNPNGIHDDDHYCSAYDLFLIARECRKYGVFNEIVQTKNFSLPATDVYPYNDRDFENTNELLFAGDYQFPYCTGIKTGYTPEAGECLVASSSKDDLNLISVVLGGKDEGGVNERFSDTKKLMEFVYGSYTFRRIADQTQPIAEVNVKNAVTDQETLDVLILTDIYTVAPDGIAPDGIRAQIDIAEEIEAPIAQNQVLGTVTYRVDGLIYETNLVAGSSVERKPFWLYNTLFALSVLLIVFIIVLLLKKRKRKN